MAMLGHRRAAPRRQWKRPGSGKYANYHELEANPFPDLPDPLVMNDGTPVTAQESWWSLRRSEIVELFDREIYALLASEVVSQRKRGEI